jgi:hypothetical protein
MPPQIPTSHKTPVILFWILGIAVVLAAAVSAYYFFVFKHAHLTTSNAPQSQVFVLVTPTQTSPYSLFQLNFKTGNISPVVVPGIPAGDQIISSVQGSGTTYYLVLDPTTYSSTIYAYKTGGSLTPLTHSTTLKSSLNFDAASHTFVYSSETITPAKNASSTPTITQKVPNITIFNPDTQKETNIGTGYNPVLINRGAFVVTFESDSSIHVINVATKADAQLLSVSPASGSYAVNPQTNEISIYNPSAATIDRYSIAQTTSATYKDSSKLATAPAFMAYAGANLVLVDRTIASSTASYSVGQASSTAAFANISLPQDVNIQSVISSYDN